MEREPQDDGIPQVSSGNLVYFPDGSRGVLLPTERVDRVFVNCQVLDPDPYSTSLRAVEGRE